MAEQPVLWWMRRDLRLQDNPALGAALETGRPVIPVYVHSPEEEGGWAAGGAQRWWLYRALERMAAGLAERGVRLTLRRGPAEEALGRLAKETGAVAVYWNRRYEPALSARDSRLKQGWRQAGLAAESFNSALLYEPWKVTADTGKPYQVYTPFWKKTREVAVARPVEVAVDRWVRQVPPEWPASDRLEEWGLLPKVAWYREMEQVWEPTEAAARARLDRFLAEAAAGYREDRNRPDLEGTSRLSPYLHFGQIGPRQVWAAVEAAGLAATAGGEVFLKEVVWREFAHHVLFHFPHTPDQPLRPEFARFPWEPNPVFLRAWQRGETGYPLVDAGMRQLWRVGWMHNRVRMVVASLLVKHLLQPWQDGARWFWDTLLDADLANNTLGWQWTAGCGADAAPYFRVFNPILQGVKFDPEGAYVKRWVPELGGLPAEWVHQPWAAPGEVARRAGVRLGDTYPRPLVEHEEGRRRALAALESLREAGAAPAGGER